MDRHNDDNCFQSNVHRPALHQMALDDVHDVEVTEMEDIYTCLLNLIFILHEANYYDND